MEKITTFLKEVKVELSKVSWPTKKQMISYTLIVIGLSLFLALFLGLLDFIFEFILNKFLLR
ncbi:MAG: preprotein translocase subunit SecE [Candidatus Yanofskybacteria bacterium RIFCSPHIGHO2_01_FULL_41_27]|uniref:Protein translocase subunit SecE n=2 Tax=Candidatus Yanofskyibacteriota TaxID=1752733 RepID=A0A1F8HVQ2_9BACT|nr:MAG: preprotein translocase subunit SecE [Candidatus Yanofskybacteria bacterium RIFCSPHIGHO2_01_FULL_41_27]OGN08894.1 MAG: preprotein translocase subunit SecE [Candidatus Yanofskybacteria bacterium RIFCSPHIGHO2_02_FULL_41_12]OGN20780.1 MAG: preprotein translocase subunit SecE [Candidatus Yanofskybacteria bacterium RIFCSPLOWO2_01_FULL_41_33]OGN41209.1 MAG: preprotein translocase subunit SecE [Candidatus Yanofskybacteria bacterium RIFOXYD1_FULL_42_10]